MAIQRPVNTVPNIDTDSTGLGHYNLTEQIGRDNVGNAHVRGGTTNVVLLESGTRNATTVSATQLGCGAAFLMLFVNVSESSGTGGLTPAIRPSPRRRPR